MKARSALPVIMLMASSCTRLAPSSEMATRPAVEPAPVAVSSSKGESRTPESTPAPRNEARPEPPAAPAPPAGRMSRPVPAAPAAVARKSAAADSVSAEPAKDKAEAESAVALAAPSRGAGASGRAAPTDDSRASAPLAPVPSGVKAGEWDDNANYREFQRWLQAESNVEFHPLDVRDRRFLVVRDEAARGVPGCAIVITDDAQHSARLVTTSSGRAILFPHAEGLTGHDLTATTSCQGSTARAAFSLAGDDGVVDLRLPAARSLPAVVTVDLGFILDTTGSMSEEIAAVKATIQKVASGLQGENAKVRVGMVEYKDRGDEFVTRTHAMTADLARFADDVAGVRASGGGDMPESVNAGLHAGITDLAWQSDSVVKLAFLVGDAPPHLDYAQDYDYAVEMRHAAERGIQVYTIAASGMDEIGQVVFRQIAQFTGATNMFVLRGGAGPESAGAGDPRSSCGGTQTAYASGNLDALILGKVKGALLALNTDPMRIAGLKGDENAKPCGERVLIAR